MPVVESRIDTVTLYQQGARVTRLLTLDCPGGRAPAELEIPRLPLALFDPTVRVRVLATGDGADLTATNVRVGLWLPPREAPLETVDQAALRTLRQQVRTVESHIRQSQWETGVFADITVPPRPKPEQGKPPPASPLGARMALEQFTHEGIQTRLAETRALTDQLRKLREEVAVLEQRLAQASTARQVTAGDLYKSVHVQLRHTGAALSRASLSVEYFVPGARWAPSYQCRLTRDCRQMELVMRAVIGQHSGEDWSGVKLVLSTAAPLSWTELPELSSIRIGRAQPPPPARAGFRPPPQGAASLFSDFDRDRQTLLRALPSPSPFPIPNLHAPSDLESLAPPVHSDPDAFMSESMDDEAEKERLPAPSMEVYAERASSMDAMEEMYDAAPVVSAGPMAPPPPAPRLQAPGASAAPARRSKELSKKADRGGPGYGAGPTQAGLEAVVFTHLRLAPASDGAHRNRLQPMDARRFYLETLARFQVEVTFDVMSAVSEAEARAQRMASTSLPGGTSDVRSASSRFDFSYTAEATVDVPSDGVFHSVALGARTGDASVLYVAVPREDSNVYRQAEVQNPLPAPMLAGPAEVYVGGEYVLSTTLPTVAPRGNFKLGLGVEQAIRCARNTRFREQRSGSKIVATTELWHDLTIDLANNLDRDITCEVRERIPQPATDAEVVVEEGTVTPAWEPYTQQERGAKALEGGRRWRLTVPAHQTQQLSAQYVVKLYANNELEGGNRREA
ncbi:mucoidy inhibitor MuiA family protein [Pyxidicoccus parkwayensis]|uniref:Mucoidy inhibitor MuiA family protein n=1 Tax=Pyxidicoccus parkwayensis TaxID=2813578 RepID=A0ABX7P1S6_9BACT|nr:mucoidy inhibitor MuiA family protein [Pyxidicoccus parkwaysis]QSQ22658.1 mucoidy inhibitor MuiA family protein [Pyxidicoccus parkwaysis]